MSFVNKKMIIDRSMEDATERHRSPDPDYENPPVVETVLGVQFDRLPGFKNAHLGAFWKTLDAKKWPSLVDAAPLQPQFERFSEAARWGAAGLQIRVTQDPTSRLQIKSDAGDRMIQIQNGRLHFNWLGQDGGDYPRYHKVREGFVWALRKFMGLLVQDEIGDFRPNQWEVTYVNHIPKGTVWSTPRDWGFFRPLGSIPTIEDLVQGESFTGEWHFVIPDQRGRLHMQWQHCLKTEHEQETEEEFIRLTLTARGPLGPDGDNLQLTLDGLDLGRTTIVRVFRQSMGDDANEFWGLQHASD
jgi:uncharacterized protein (TIGR04255 family)